MSTLIKKNGTWTKVAGHTVWMGTKQMLNAAITAGELADGTEVMVTDDYEEVQDVTNVSITPISGISVLYAYYTRVGNVVQFTITISCTSATKDTHNALGANVFSGDVGKFPKPKLPRNVASIQSWTYDAQDASGYFFFDSNGNLHMSAAVGLYNISGTYICND